MIGYLHAHIYVGYGIIAGLVLLALLLLAVAVRVSRPHTGSRVRDDRYQGHHTAEAVVEKQWAADHAEHDCHWPDCRDSAACDYQGHQCFALSQIRSACPLSLDPAAIDDVRSAWVREPRRTLTADRPPWESAGFPAIPRTVQTVTLPEPIPDDELDRFKERFLAAQRDGRWHRVYVLPDFPGPSDSPARDAGAERLAASSTTGGEPSTDLPGRVQTPMQAPAGDPFWRRILAFLRRTPDLPVVSAVRLPSESGSELITDYGHDGEPVLEGRIITGPPPPVLGYIDGLALTSTYYERIEQIGVQARVLALAAAA